MESSQFQERFRCEEIVSDEEKILFYKLRYEEYAIKRGWEQTNPAEIETDYFDQFSYHFGCFKRDDNSLIAAARLIDAQRTTLFFEKYIQTAISRNGLEVSRFILDKKNIGKKYLFMLRGKLFYLLYEFAERNQYEYFYAFITAKHFRGLQRSGGKFFDKISDEINFKNNYYVAVRAGIATVKELSLKDLFWKFDFFRNI